MKGISSQGEKIIEFTLTPSDEKFHFQDIEFVKVRKVK